MPDRRRVPLKAALHVGPFIFNRTIPEERACSEYLLDAPRGQRAARMLRLLLLGHKALRERPTPATTDREE
jgi:hypothetical protein